MFVLGTETVVYVWLVAVARGLCFVTRCLAAEESEEVRAAELCPLMYLLDWSS